MDRKEPVASAEASLFSVRLPVVRIDGKKSPGYPD